MKIITTLLLVFLNFTISYAQEGKPTKEETLQYIKNELEGKIMMYTHYTSKTNLATRNPLEDAWELYSTYSNLKMESCILEVQDERKKIETISGYSSGNKFREEEDLGTSLIKIDFSRTESITFYITDYFIRERDRIGEGESRKIPSGLKFIGLLFKQKKSDGTYEKDVVISIGTLLPTSKIMNL